MFSLNLFRVKTFNYKFVLNARKLNVINAKYISSSVNVGQTTDDSIGSSSAIRYPNRQRLESRLSKDLLSNIFTLSQNVSKGKRSINELVDEKEFEAICDQIENQIRDMSNKELIKCLHSFLVMGLDANSKIIQNLENQLMWRTKTFKLKELLECLSFHVRYQLTDQQKKAVNELTLNLVLKLDTASDADDIVHMFSLWRSLNTEIIEKMELIAIEMLGSNDSNFSIDSLSYILVLLSQMNRRTRPLITAIIDRFTYSSVPSNKTNEKNIIRMISALNRLNYPDVNFLRKASDLLCNNKFLDKVMPSDRRDLLVAVSQLNWSYPRLLDQFVDKITDTNNDLSSQDFLVLVSSFARLYSGSVYLNDILSHYVTPYVKREDLDCESWLVYVWSLSILGYVPLECVHSVLNQRFYEQLMNQINSKSNESQNYKQLMANLKLLNIKAVAEIEMSENIDFQPFSSKAYVIAKKEVAVEKFKKSMAETLVSIVPNIATNVLTPYGFAIDAEFVVNEKFNSLPLKGLSLSDVNDNRLPALPEGYQRYALMCFGFNDSLLNDSGFVGVHELSIRLLKRLGYNVIAVTETEFPSYLRGNQKSDRLKSLIKAKNIE